MREIMKPGLVSFAAGFVPTIRWASGPCSGASLFRGASLWSQHIPASFAEELSLTFADVEGRALVDVIVSERIKTTSFRGSTGEVKLQKDGTFQLILRVESYG